MRHPNICFDGCMVNPRAEFVVFMFKEWWSKVILSKC